MYQQLARIEKDYYKPKHRRFNKKTDIRWRVVYPNLETLGVKKESFRIKEDALKRLDTLNNTARTLLKCEDWTVEDVLHLWQTKKLITLRSETRERCKLPIITKHLGAIKVADLSEENIIRFKNVLKKEKSVRTVNGYLVTLRTALNYAKRKGMVRNSPDISEHVDSALEIKRESVITPEEFERLLEACSVKKSGRSRTHLVPYLLWLHETGCRTGELARIEVKDIHLERGIVRIWSGKAKRPVQRECGITPRLRKHILDSGLLERCGLVFGEQSRWHRSFFTACRIAGIKDFRLHDLRRTAITNMLEKGVPLHLVAKMVGHSSGSILTLDVYTKFRSDFIQEMMMKMN